METQVQNKLSNLYHTLIPHYYKAQCIHSGHTHEDKVLRALCQTLNETMPCHDTYKKYFYFHHRLQESQNHRMLKIRMSLMSQTSFH